MRVAIIPAKGQSKRLPNKNILPYRGVPMVAYVVSTALESNVFDRVVVSTDNRAIADIATHAGAEVLFRPSYLAKDGVEVPEVCLFVLEEMRFPEIFCAVLPTAVMLTPGDLRKSYQQLGNADAVMGVSRYRIHPYKALVLRDGYLQPVYPQVDQGSESYPDLFAANGQLCWARTDVFLKHKAFYLPKLVGYEIPDIDIDTEDDYRELLK